jgi:hypothetical protein
MRNWPATTCTAAAGPSSKLPRPHTADRASSTAAGARWESTSEAHAQQQHACMARPFFAFYGGPLPRGHCFAAVHVPLCNNIRRVYRETNEEPQPTEGGGETQEEAAAGNRGSASSFSSSYDSSAAASTHGSTHYYTRRFTHCPSTYGAGSSATNGHDESTTISTPVAHLHSSSSGDGGGTPCNSIRTGRRRI